MGGKEMKLPQVISFLAPPEISPHPGPFVYYVVDLGDGRVRLFLDADGRFGPAMPRVSVKHFVNDLSGKVVLPLRGHREIDAVLKGRAKLLGKGDDGLVFRVGSKIVKVSTTVPFQPHNAGHLSPEEAVGRLRQQTEMHNRLAAIAPNVLDRADFLKHGDKGFQIKPYVEIPTRFTRPQLDQLQDGIIAIHRAGFCIGDDIQAGIRNGKPIMFDVGKAAELAPNDAARGIWSAVKSDMDNLGRLYKQSRQVFVRRDVDEAQQMWDHARKVLARRPGKLNNYAVDTVRRASELRREQAKATFRGRDLAKRLQVIDSEERRVLASLT
jgi:hypothetical protein